MDPVGLARIQFAITTVYHFFFVPLTLGLAVLVAIMETLYVATGEEVYKKMTKFWGKLFVINFVMGVVTGIVQEFQFGMNWSEYSRYVGDIFGAPLAIEALAAFFLESTFLGLWLFGWDKLSKRMHLFTIWMVAIGSTLSALWILVANSFMQAPMGYVERNGRLEMSNFFELLFNPNVWVQFPHVLFAGFTTGAFFVLGISAYHLLRKNNVDLYRRSFKIAAIVGVISISMTGLIGHSHGQHTMATQPMKMAAAEALWETESPASFSLLTIGDLTQRKELFSIRIPALLCLISYNTLDCEVQGIYNLQAQYEQMFGPGNYIPPVAFIYWSFRAMVGAGTLLFLLGVLALWILRRDITNQKPIILRIFLWAIALPYLANTAGWLLTELGRYPWVVYKLMRIEDGNSPLVSSGQIWLTLIGFTVIYGVLMAADIYLLAKYAKDWPQDGEEAQPIQGESIPSLIGAQD
jgi:cytochrome d ubiquinol oxidase subunit I